jgi:type VI secretion system secreted protein VgrG
MAISTKTTIIIDGEKMTRFSELSINQSANAHHTFSIIQPVPREFVDQAIDKSQSYIGKTIKIEIEPNTMRTDEPFVFNGIITQANLMRKNGSAGEIHINGFSPTIALEGLPNSKSYTDKTFSDITQEILNNYTQIQLRPLLNFNNTTSLPYIVQYNESDFAFLRRMAQKKGEWLYFNGEQLVFGKPKSTTFTLEYGRSLHSFNIEMNVKPLDFEYTGYDSSSGETQTANSKQINYQAKGYSKEVFDASNKLFSKTSNSLYNNPIEENSAFGHLNSRVTTQMESMASSLIVAKGESDETGLRIGDVIVINESGFSATGNPQDAVKEQNYGSYIITSLSHSCEEVGHYKNTFEAVPENSKTPPYSNVHSIPTANSQPAIVTDNNDPKGLGRVQVQMEWQKNNSENTPWIRMTNPHAGGGKGMYFIPEIGEEVLIDFEGGNAEKPYVLGAMYNGNKSSNYSTAGNDKKVIQTRSGTKIIMNDAIGSVFIEDPSGNTWLMDGKGNISVNAPNDISMNAGGSVSITAIKNVNVNAGINQTVNVGVNQNTSVGVLNNTFVGGHNLLNIVGNHIENIDGNKQVNTEKEIAINSQKGVGVSSEENIEKHSQKEVKVNSGEKSKMF